VKRGWAGDGPPLNFWFSAVFPFPQVGQNDIEHAEECGAVIGVLEVATFVEHDVFYADCRSFDEFRIKEDFSSGGAAAPALGHA
jgi:hypothetical protein